MKILQLIQKPQLRGAEIFAFQLASRLESRGHQVRLVALFPGEADLGDQGLIQLNADPSVRLLDWRAWKKLAEIIREFEPDIVQANAGDTLKYAACSRVFFRWGGKLVFRNANLISGFLDSGAKRRFNSLLLGQVDGVASVSEHCMRDFVSVFQWRKPIFHLPIGVPQALVKPALPNDLRLLLQDAPFLIHIGSFVPEKNHAGLFQIFEKVKSRMPTIKLLLCGSGPLFSQILQSLPDGVIALGARADVGNILPFAHALVLPSQIEGLPGVILEAMAARVPVVAYDVGGVSEVVRPGQTGSLVPRGEASLFAEELVQILSMDKITIAPILENASNLVRENYSLDKVCDGFEKFFYRLLKG